MTFATMHFTDADTVLRTLIVVLGGFVTVTAFLLALSHLWTWRSKRVFAGLLFGLQTIVLAGLAALTTDHIHRHLIDDEAAAWQLWTALGSFGLGVPVMIALLSIRFDRSSNRPPP